MEPIRGIRWKCGDCGNYDLCPICHPYSPHNSTHVFLEVRQPRGFSEGPLLTQTTQGPFSFGSSSSDVKNNGFTFNPPTTTNTPFSFHSQTPPFTFPNPAPVPNQNPDNSPFTFAFSNPCPNQNPRQRNNAPDPTKIASFSF